MLARGIHYREFHCFVETQDGSGFVIWAQLADGGSAVMYVSFDEFEQRAFQIEESQHAPEGVAVQ